MVKKKNTDNISNDDNTNNLHFNLNLDNIDDENFKKEVFDVYNAINEGKIDLSPEEKKEILQELELIINHLSNNEVNGNSDIDKPDDALNDLIGGNSVEDSVGSVDVEDDVVSVDDALNDLIDDTSVEDSTPIDAVVFEDSIAGATAAITAGMRTCMVPQIKQPDTFVREHAFKIYSSLQDIYPDMDELLG